MKFRECSRALPRMGALRLVPVVALVLGGLVVFSGTASAQEGAEEFNSVIRPIFEARCIECHGAEKQEGGYRMDTREALLEAGHSGYVGIIPGNATFSNLVRRLTLPPDNPDVMPPADQGLLTPEQIVAIMHWINRGAQWEEGVTLTAQPAEEAPAFDPFAGQAPEAETVPAVVVEGGVDFVRDVLPVFEARCFECHEGNRPSGAFGMETKEALLKGGIGGAAILAGNAAESLLVELITLPAGHRDIMPADGDPLTPEQIALITQWIEEGANFGDWTSVPVAEPEAPNLLELLAEGLEPAPQEKLAGFQEQGAIAMQLGQTSPLVRVDFQLAGASIGDEEVAKLPEIAEHLTWLNLANTSVTDAGLAPLEQLKKLTSLHLEQTAVTDAGLKHVAGLEHLQYLNLYGTKVSDAGLEHLSGLNNLQKLYLWQTDVTPEGVEKLKAAIPGLDVNIGAELELTLAEPAEAGAPAALAVLFDAEACCAKAAADGDACDHPCCVEAAEKGEVCVKCNPGAEKLQQLVALFDEGGCCANAIEGGAFCDHPCCLEAQAAGTVCAKCNPEGADQAPTPEAAAPAPEAPAEVELAAAFDAESCCAKAVADEGACAHPCCVTAAEKEAVCFKCNPESGKTAALEAGFSDQSCCFKAFLASNICDHPCCVEAAEASAICEGCNPAA